MFDSQGNVWVGNNFLVGAQNQSILWTGNLSKFAPERPAAVADDHRLHAAAVCSGVGFGLAIDAQDKVWADSYASQNITLFDNAGKPLSPPEG